MSKTEEEILFLSYTRANEVPRVNVTNVMRKVIQAYNFWMKIPKEKCIATEEIWKLVDTSRFMLDELQNLSGSSRTKIHQDDTVAADINAANYAICTALEKCFDLDYSKAAPIYIKQTLQFHRGQGLEIYWRDFCQCPTEEEYKQMCVRSKYERGSIYQLTVQLMQLFSSITWNFSKLSDILAQFFQIYEDYVVLSTNENVLSSKPLNFTFPIIHAIQSHPGDTQIINILKQKCVGKEMRMYVITLLEEFGSFEYTKQKILQLRDEIYEEMKKFDENPYMLQLIESALSQMDTFL